MKLTKHRNKIGDECWSIDTVGNCGKYKFDNVVTVFEPYSKNPGVLVESPLGLRGLKKAITLIEEERLKNGLTTLE